MVHPITENSPFYQFTKDDFQTIDGELFVFMKTFDDMYSSTVATATSYTFKELIYGAKFDIMYTENNDKMKTILNLNKLNSFTKLHLD